MNRFKNFDFLLFLPTVLLLAFGIVVILSTDTKLAQEQLLFAVVGLILYLLVAFTSPEYLRAFSPLFYLLSIALLLITLSLGTLTRGAIRWIPLGFGNFTLQTSELSKFFLIMAFAAFFSSKLWQTKVSSFASSLLLIGLPAFLVYIQPDLGTTIILGAIWLVLLISTGKNLKFLLFLTALFVVFSPFLWQTLKPYQQQRIFTFINPNLDPLGSGYHILQSKIAIGSGQIFGRGFGQGTQSRLKFLPEYHNDFIFAALSEEWGLLGSTLLLTLYLLIFYRTLAIYNRADLGPFEKLLCLGVFTMIFAQFTINVGMNLGLAPVTGIPLPLVSSGGSTTITTLLSLGLIQAVARHRSLS